MRTKALSDPHDTMTSRERVLAALNREPVDRIPYCGHLVDPVVAMQAAPALGLGDPAPLAALIQQAREARAAGDRAFGMEVVLGKDTYHAPRGRREGV